MPSSFKQLEFEKQLDLTRIREFRKLGNIEILEELYEKYFFLVFGLGLKYFKNRDQAKEMASLIFEKFTIEAVKNEIPNLRGWLYVNSKNYCLTELQKSENGNNLTSKKDLVSLDDYIYQHPLDLDKRIPEPIKSAISKLEIKQKDCLNSFYVKKLNYRQISENFNIEIEEVISLIQKGKKNLELI